MPNLNSVQLMGNCTRDPELSYTPKGIAVASLSLAINRVYSTDQGEKREECTFVEVELWGRQAEIAGEYLKKGRPVFIQGRLKLDSWDDKTTGQKRSKMRVVGEAMQLLGSRDGGGGESREDSHGDYEAPRGRPSRAESQPPARKQPPKPPADPDPDADMESDIPF